MKITRLGALSITKKRLASKECLPYLRKSSHAHILNISPPLNMAAHWFSNHVAYTMAKYGMSMCVLGMAQEFKQDNVAVNALWPQTIVQTAALDILSGSGRSQYARKTEIMADAAYVILSKAPDVKANTGNFYIDETVLLAAGVKDLKQYACVPENADNLIVDIYVEPKLAKL